MCGRSTTTRVTPRGVGGRLGDIGSTGARGRSSRRCACRRVRAAPALPEAAADAERRPRRRPLRRPPARSRWPPAAPSRSSSGGRLARAPATAWRSFCATCGRVSIKAIASSESAWRPQPRTATIAASSDRGAGGARHAPALQPVDRRRQRIAEHHAEQDRHQDRLGPLQGVERRAARRGRRARGCARRPACAGARARLVLRRSSGAGAFVAGRGSAIVHVASSGRAWRSILARQLRRARSRHLARVGRQRDVVARQLGRHRRIEQARRSGAGRRPRRRRERTPPFALQRRRDPAADRPPAAASRRGSAAGRAPRTRSPTFGGVERRRSRQCGCQYSITLSYQARPPRSRRPGRSATMRDRKAV